VEAAFPRRDKGVQLSEERNSPHEVTAHDGQDERRSPESKERERVSYTASQKGSDKSLLQKRDKLTLGFRPWEQRTMTPRIEPR
jgi:hypothetical protein